MNTDHERIHQSNSAEWYTPPEYIEAARQVMRGIDLDPASCAYANAHFVKARLFFDKEVDGLSQDWHGRIFLNPPYGKTGAHRKDGTWNPKAGRSNAEVWTEKILSEWELRHVEQAILLVNAVPGAKWFQSLWDFPICFTDHRIAFFRQLPDPGPLPRHERQRQPTHYNAFVYLGFEGQRFYRIFKQFGNVVVRMDSCHADPAAPQTDEKMARLVATTLALRRGQL